MGLGGLDASPPGHQSEIVDGCEDSQTSDSRQNMNSVKK